MSTELSSVGLIFFRMDWLDLFAVQGTLKSLLQHHTSKASILWHSAFFIVQLSHPYMTTGKTIALTRQTFVGKVTSLLFNMLSRLEKEMAIHSSVLAWRIPGTEEPGRLQSVHGVAKSRTRLEQLHSLKIVHNFSSKEQASFNFMAAVTICSDFGDPQNKVSHCFHCFFIYLPLVIHKIIVCLSINGTLG